MIETNKNNKIILVVAILLFGFFWFGGLQQQVPVEPEINTSVVSESEFHTTYGGGGELQLFQMGRIKIMENGLREMGLQ